MIRPMAPTDVNAVAALEASAFSTPWSADTFLRLLDRPGAELHVMEEGGSLVGYGVLWCILDQGELANIAIAPEARGRGLGGRLLAHFVAVARRRGVRRLFLEVRQSNAVALRLYSSRGFEEIGRRRDYYERPKEDALVLELKIPKTEGKALS